MLKHFVYLICILSMFAANTNAQDISRLKIAVLNTDETQFSEKFSAQFFQQISKQKNLKTLDRDLTNAARRGIQVENLFNLSLVEAKNIGVAVDCDFYFVIRAENQRRSSSIKDYFESAAVIFLVGTRTGNLISWENPDFTGANAEISENKLFAEIPSLTERFVQKLRAAHDFELTKLKRNVINLSKAPTFEDLPDDANDETSHFRAPLPYRRLRPNYTAAANKADIKATVDVFVYLNENGEIEKVETERWAGFDLDEETIETVQKMQFRPASKDGKPLSVRVLLRYNFLDIKKDDE